VGRKRYSQLMIWIIVTRQTGVSMTDSTRRENREMSAIKLEFKFRTAKSKCTIDCMRKKGKNRPPTQVPGMWWKNRHSIPCRGSIAISSDE